MHVAIKHWVPKYDSINVGTCYIIVNRLNWTRRHGYSGSHSILFLFTCSSFLTHELIGRWNIVQGVALFVSFYDPPCKRNLLTNHIHKCLPLSSSTSGCSSNASYIFAWITGEVKEYNMIHFGKVDPTRCSAINFKSIKLLVTECVFFMEMRKNEVQVASICQDQKKKCVSKHSTYQCKPKRERLLQSENWGTPSNLLA